MNAFELWDQAISLEKRSTRYFSRAFLTVILADIVLSYIYTPVVIIASFPLLLIISIWLICGSNKAESLKRKAKQLFGSNEEEHW